MNSSAPERNLRGALLWSALWVSLAVLFGLWLTDSAGAAVGSEFFTVYLVEKSLSIDNLLMFLIIFKTFSIDRPRQRKLLYLGVIGAMLLRGIMITLGAELLVRFQWIVYVFGAFLIYSGFKLFRNRGESFDPDKSRVIKMLRDRFSVAVTALIAIEAMDIIFAVDSIPAAFGVTRDPFIVFTANIFAILGLRSLYFVLEDVMGRLRYLKYGLATILCVIGAKMCLEPVLHIESWTSLAIVFVILAVTAGFSVAAEPKLGQRT